MDEITSVKPAPPALAEKARKVIFGQLGIPYTQEPPVQQPMPSNANNPTPVQQQSAPNYTNNPEHIKQQSVPNYVNNTASVQPKTTTNENMHREPQFNTLPSPPDPEPPAPPKKKEGCYIATAVYGSYDAPEVKTLRRFRDEVLARSLPGRMFIKVYYTLSPSVAKRLRNARHLNNTVRIILDKWVEKLEKKQH